MAPSTDVGQVLTGQRERDETCEKHGRYVSRNLIARVWSKCPACSAEERAAEDELAKAQERERLERRHKAMIADARIPARFVGRTFDSFVVSTEPQRQALTVVREYAQSFEQHRKRGTGLVLSGMPGTGKSHLAAAVLQSVLSPNVRYLTCLDLIRTVRDTWRRDSEKSETQVLAYLESLDLLVIDEVGVQYGTDGEQTVLFEVLDRRYREEMPVILLTNQNKDGFKKFVGDRSFDRLTETCRWVSFDWDSYRATARKAK